MEKKTLFVFVLFLVLILFATTSFFMINHKPKASKYTRAKLVYDHVLSIESMEM